MKTQSDLFCGRQGPRHRAVTAKGYSTILQGGTCFDDSPKRPELQGNTGPSINRKTCFARTLLRSVRHRVSVHTMKATIRIATPAGRAATRARRIERSYFFVGRPCHRRRSPQLDSSHVVHAKSPLRLRGVRVGGSSDAGSADTHHPDARVTLHHQATRSRRTSVFVGAPA